MSKQHVQTFTTKVRKNFIGKKATYEECYTSINHTVDINKCINMESMDNININMEWTVI